MKKGTIKKLEELFEKAEVNNPQNVIENILIPNAIKDGSSILKAIQNYENIDDTGINDQERFNFHMAMKNVHPDSLNNLDIHRKITSKTVLR